MDFSQVKPHQNIKYTGKSWAFGGVYKAYPIEETYLDIDDCPVEDRGKLVIIELMNDGTPMYFKFENLRPDEWELTDEEY